MTDIAAAEAGTYELQGKQLYVIISDNALRSMEGAPFEKHAKYIDIHYVAEGLEMIGGAPADEDMIPYEDEIMEKDYALYQIVDQPSYLLLKPGTYAVMFPSDLHQPGVHKEAGQTVRKAVIKIHMDLLHVHTDNSK
ncbi:unnamed protein product [Aphanomyces euteiches]